MTLIMSTPLPARQEAGALKNTSRPAKVRTGLFQARAGRLRSAETPSMPGGTCWGREAVAGRPVRGRRPAAGPKPGIGLGALLRPRVRVQPLQLVLVEGLHGPGGA